MNGKLYGVGVGPGDPELLTLKAVRIIGECSYIAIPANSKENCTAYNIVAQALPEIEAKKFLYIPMPMAKDKELLEKSHGEGAKTIEALLEKGESICFLTLGDPTIYSTYLYIHKIVCSHGYDTEIINGIPSFCASAAALNAGLVESAEPLVIVPASYPVEEFLSLPGTKVLMKAGRQLAQVKSQLKHTALAVSMIENCGMANQHIYKDIDLMPDESGYFSLIIARQPK